jgi:hypothetical protein
MTRERRMISGRVPTTVSTFSFFIVLFLRAKAKVKRAKAKVKRAKAKVLFTWFFLKSLCY